MMNSIHGRLCRFAAALLALPLAAQVAPPASEEAVVLAAFEVSSTRGAGYRATNANSGTRINLQLRDVPQTISVITSDFLRDTNAFDLDEALTYASGVAQSEFAASRFSIRGFNTGAPKRNGLTYNPLQPVDTVAIDRVDVVKGPSAVLYGVGSPGGVVNILTKKPLAQAQREARVLIDSEGSYRGELDLGGPVVESGSLKYRFVASYEDYQQTLDFGQREKLFVMPVLSYTLREGPTPTIITASLDWSHLPGMVSADERWPQVAETRAAPLPANPNRTINAAVAYVPGLPRTFNIAGPNAKREGDELYFETNVVHHFTEALQAKLVYGTATTAVDRFTQFAAGSLRADASGNLPTTVPVQSFFSEAETEAENFQVDVTWAGEVGGVKLDLIAGGSYETLDVEQDQWRNLTRPAFNLFNPGAADYNLGVFPVDYQRLQHTFQRRAESALWLIGNARLFEERLGILAGVRQTEVERAENYNLLSGSRVLTSNTKADLDPNYQAGLTYRLSPALSLFASYTEAQQTNGNFPNNPQSGDGYEAGLRFEVGGGRLSGAVSVFDFTNRNIERRDPNLPGVVFVLSGEERSRGVEFDLFWVPTDEWQLVVNYTDMDPTVVSNVSAPITEGSLINSAFPQAFNFFAKYAPRRGPLANFYASVGYNYRSRSRPFGTIEALHLLENPSYELVNLTVGWAPTRGTRETGVSYELAVKNLFDEFYYGNTAIQGEGRLVVGSVRVSF